MNELKEMIGGIDDDHYNELMFQIDKDGDGGIDLDEFKEICMKMPNTIKLNNLS